MVFYSIISAAFDWQLFGIPYALAAEFSNFVTMRTILKFIVIAYALICIKIIDLHN